MFSSGNSLRGCLYLHLGQNIANVFSTNSSYFCFTCITSKCVVKEIRISVVKLSNKLPIYALVTPALEDLCILVAVSHS
jgi:hypothetical protein